MKLIKVWLAQRAKRTEFNSNGYSISCADMHIIDLLDKRQDKLELETSNKMFRR